MITLTALLPFSAAADGQVIPMSTENAKDMKLFGEGVVGKAVAAKPLTDLAHAGAWKPGDSTTIESDIEVGPADVKDVQYVFYAPGVGKVAEIEALSVSALLIYHSHDKTAKVLTKHPGSSK
jgi:hypothetical protein